MWVSESATTYPQSVTLSHYLYSLNTYRETVISHQTVLHQNNIVCKNNISVSTVGPCLFVRNHLCVLVELYNFAYTLETLVTLTIIDIVCTCLSENTQVDTDSWMADSLVRSISFPIRLDQFLFRLDGFKTFVFTSSHHNEYVFLCYSRYLKQLFQIAISLVKMYTKMVKGLCNLAGNL